MKIIHPAWDVKIYDPRKGEDFKGYGISSTLKDNFFAVHIFSRLKFFDNTPSKSFDQMLETIKMLMEIFMPQMGKRGFFSCSLISKKGWEIITQEFNDINRIDNALLVYFEISESNIQKIFELRKKIQTYEEWVIGSCNGNFRRLGELRIQDYTEQLQNISSCFWVDGELGSMLILIRNFENIDKVLTPIYALLDNN